jgi:hypothetical protein
MQITADECKLQHARSFLEDTTSDDPDLPLQIRGVLTCGFEIEQPVAICPRSIGGVDPHPADGRRLTTADIARMTEWSKEFVSFGIDKVSEVLRNVDDIKIKNFHRPINGLKEEEEGKENDPHLVHFPFMPLEYMAWYCQYDSSLGIEKVSPDEYSFPTEMKPKAPGGRGLAAAYSWFNAKITSPPMNSNDPFVRESLRRVCHALKKNLRLIRPMKSLTSGFHIHIGNTAGWKLLHAQNLLTLYVVIEEKLRHLHKEERQNDYGHCLNLSTGSDLGFAIQDEDQYPSRPKMTVLPRNGPETRARLSM